MFVPDLAPFAPLVDLFALSFWVPLATFFTLFVRAFSGKVLLLAVLALYLVFATFGHVPKLLASIAYYFFLLLWSSHQAHLDETFVQGFLRNLVDYIA